MAPNPFGKSKAPPFGKDKTKASEVSGDDSAPEAKMRAGRRRGTSSRNRKTSRR